MTATFHYRCGPEYNFTLQTRGTNGPNCNKMFCCSQNSLVSKDTLADVFLAAGKSRPDRTGKIPFPDIPWLINVESATQHMNAAHLGVKRQLMGRAAKAVGIGGGHVGVSGTSHFFGGGGTPTEAQCTVVATPARQDIALQLPSALLLVYIFLPKGAAVLSHPGAADGEEPAGEGERALLRAPGGYAARRSTVLRVRRAHAPTEREARHFRSERRPGENRLPDAPLGRGASTTQWTGGHPA